MNLDFHTFDVQPIAARALPEKELIWPTAIGFGLMDSSSDSKRFPEYAAIKARIGAQNAEPLSVFVNAIRDAQSTILILDDYLFKPLGDDRIEDRLIAISDWFEIGTSASDIRILTGGLPKTVEREIELHFKDHAKLLNQINQYPKGIDIQIRFSLQIEFPYVHDRFAILDNELWHFGATVGGLHRQVNAASRGWNAAECGAVHFFDLAWSGGKNMGNFSKAF